MKWRLTLIVTCAAIWFLALGARLGYLQVVRHDAYLARAESQHQRVVELDPPRGTIFDRHGRQLAVSLEVDSAFAVPDEVEDPAATALALAGVLGGEAAEYEALLRQDREFVWIARKLNPPVAARLRELGLEGIDFLPESKRYYPNRELAASVLGFVGTDNVGLAGIEAAWDELVAGTGGRQTVLRDARRGTVVVPDLASLAAEPGADLVLTLDAALQHISERALNWAVEEFDAEGGSVVLLDPRNGAILALASNPGFDPNRFLDYPKSHWINRPISHAYEPGSTFKIFTVAAGLEHNLIDPSDTFYCEMGGITLAGVRISDHHPFGELTVRQILIKSSNVGAIKIGLTAGAQNLHREIVQFGFGEATGVGLPGESAGLLRPISAWRRRTAAYVSFGQGISVTPLQLAVAVAAVANGGTLYRPYILTAVRDGQEVDHRAYARAVGHPIRASTARSLGRMLEAVVEKGTGQRAALPGYRVAGKTGTAQKAVPGIGYAPGHYVGSFVAFAPAREPRLVGVAVIDEPGGWRYHGGTVAAPVVRRIFARALPLLEIPPSVEEERPQPAPPVRLETAFARRTPTGTVPDFTGLTTRQVVLRAAQRGVPVRLDGSGGFVVRQQPPAGTALGQLAAEEPVRLWLASTRPATWAGVEG